MLFAEIADAYFERGMYAEAKPTYELLDPGDSAVCKIVSVEKYSLSNQLDYRPVTSIFFFKQQHA